ncbi:TPA: hypothetical protein QDB14_006109 [Burkholderia vietnamiensis]|nr:hypothetical protein [Burkholderia vietnamiensis]
MNEFVDIRSMQYEGWSISIAVRKPINGPHPHRFFVERQEIRPPETSTFAAVPFEVHNGPFDTPEAAYEKGFGDCKRMIDRFIASRKRTDGA